MNGIIDFDTGRVVECHDSECLAGILFGMFDSCLCDGVNLVLHHLDVDSLVCTAARRGQLLDALVVYPVVGEADKGCVGILCREPELAGRDSLPECRGQDAFLEEYRMGLCILIGVIGLVIDVGTVRVANEDYPLRSKDDRQSLGHRDAVGVKYNGYVKRVERPQCFV